MHSYTMSEISVNEHLEGILSDFEALKRSFDIEDADDVPPFSPPSSLSAPVSPSPSHSFINHNNPIESRDKSGMPPSLAFNNNNNNSLVSAARHISSNPSPILKPRNLSSSLSFNRATMIKPAIHNNGSSVIRASSFQSRLNPNGLLTWPGNGNDSLHSSTSSLEYSGSVGGCLSPSKPGLFPRIFPEEEHHLPQFPQLPPEKNENFENKLQPKKFSSFGNVSHSEKDQDSGIRLGVSQPSGINHCSITSLDLQIPDEEGGLANMHRGRGGDQMSPNIRHNNANWNGRHINATAYGEEGYCGTRNHHQQKVTQMLKVSHLKVKEMPRLNKFPLDLDSLVNSTSPIKVQGQSMSPHQPKPHPMSSVDHLYHPTPPSTSVSSSASLSSLESSSDTSFQHSYLSVFPCSLTPSQDTIKGPPACSPLSTEQGPQTKISLGFKGVPSVSNQSGSYSLQGDKSNLSLGDVESEASDSVGSILQRIASFSQHATPDIIQAGIQHKLMQSDAGLSSPSDTKPRWKQEVKKQKETCGKPEAGPTIPMEDTQKDKCIMGQVQEGDGMTQEQPANMNTQDSVMVKEGLDTEKEERGTEKGMDEGELQKEVQLEAELKIEFCHSEPGRQLNYIHGSDLFGYVGIEAVLDQMRNKTMKVGFDFNIIVVGQSGLGKSTLVNTLFKSKVSRKSCSPEYEAKISKTVKLQKISHVIEEKGVKMKLTVIDTPGFGDQINNDNCWEPIIKYVNEQYEKYLREELNVNRKRRIPDNRVHCCIYFLPATGHRLRSIDIEFMKRLGRIVSIVPVIAKADTLTIEERQEFKERIRQDLASNGISVYPQKEYDEDPQERIINDRIRENIPFAVVGTDKEHQVNGNKVLGRKTKWGIIEVENVEHCEFAYLRDLVIRSHLQDLKDVTHNIHYETYRMQRLNESNVNFTEAGLSTWLRDHRTAGRSGNESHL